MSRLLSMGAIHAVNWFAHLEATGVDLTTNAHLKVKKEAVEFADEPSLEEAADVIIATLGACYHQGWTLQEVAMAIIKKVAVNRARQWERQEDGTWQHVPGT